MGQKFAAYDASGNIIGFYDSVESPVPEGVAAIAITDDEWMAAWKTGGYTVVKGALTPPQPAAAPTLKDIKAEQMRIIMAAAQDDLAKVVAGYPGLEIATWPQQYAEAQAYSASGKATTPILASIAKESGRTVDELAVTVMEKAAAYQSECGAIVGKRIARMIQITSATTAKKVQSIVW